MLQRGFRLKRRRDFNRLYRHGRFSNQAALNIKCLPNQLPKCRLAVVVSTKVAKSAVVRNRLRRRVHGQLAELVNDLRLGFDLVVVVTEDISQLPPPALRASLVKGMSKLGLLKPGNRAEGV